MLATEWRRVIEPKRRPGDAPPRPSDARGVPPCELARPGEPDISSAPPNCKRSPIRWRLATPELRCARLRPIMKEWRSASRRRAMRRRDLRSDGRGIRSHGCMALQHRRESPAQRERPRPLHREKHCDAAWRPALGDKRSRQRINLPFHAAAPQLTGARRRNARR